MARPFQWLPLLLTILLLAASPGLSQEIPDVTQTLETVGGSRIYSGNITSARQHAMQASWDAAVSRAVANLLTTDAIQANFPLLSEAIFNRSQQFVRNFQVLGEAQEGEYIQVLARVTVGVGAIRQALLDQGIIEAERKKPLVMILVSTGSQEAGNLVPWWQDRTFLGGPPEARGVLEGVLTGDGFPVMDESLAVQNLAASPDFDSKAMDRDAALRFAAGLGAQVLVISDSKTREAGNVMGTVMRSYEANITAKAFRTDTGEMLASTGGTARAVAASPEEGTAQAVRRAAEKAARDLGDQVQTAWTRTGAGPGGIRLVVANIKPLANLVTFRKVLMEGVAGVEKVVPKSMTDDEAAMEVTFEGDPQDLAQALLVKDYGRFGINVAEVGPGRMRIELVPR